MIVFLSVCHQSTSTGQATMSPPCNNYRIIISRLTIVSGCVMYVASGDLPCRQGDVKVGAMARNPYHNLWYGILRIVFGRSA